MGSARHLIEQFETSPILAITSAEKRSGKTRLLDCLELLVPHPFRAIVPSEAVVYTVLSRDPRPTLLLDEADAIFGSRSRAERFEGLRAILNAGNRRGTPVPRVNMEGRRREVEYFDVYGPKAVAGIGNLPDTVSDRAIPIRLKRRAPGEIVERFRARVAKAEADQISKPRRKDSAMADDIVAGPPTLLRPREVGERLGVGSWTVERLMRTELPVVQVGRHSRRVPAQALADWIESKTSERITR